MSCSFQDIHIDLCFPLMAIQYSLILIYPNLPSHYPLLGSFQFLAILNSATLNTLVCASLQDDYVDRELGKSDRTIQKKKSDSKFAS